MEELFDEIDRILDKEEKEPNIENLRKYVHEKGPEIKDYKEFVRILEQNYPSARKKRDKQEERFRNYFQFRTKGRTVIIEKIYDKPVTQLVTNRSNYKYNIANILPKLIEDEGVVQEIDGYKTKVLYMSLNKLRESFGFYNTYFHKTRVNYQSLDSKNMEKYEEFVREWDDYAEEFLGTYDGQMDKEFMLGWFFGTVIYKANASIKNSLKAFNDDGKIFTMYGYEICFKSTEDDKGFNKTRYIFPGDSDYGIIEKCEQAAIKFCEDRINENIRHDNEIADKIGAKKRSLVEGLGKSEVYVRGYGRLYWNQLEKNIASEFKIDGCIFEYCRTMCKIYFSEDFVLNTTDNIDIMRFRRALNNAFIKKIYNEFVRGQHKVPKEDEEMQWLFVDLEEVSEWAKKSIDQYKAEHYVVDNSIRKKDECYNDYDLGSLQILIMMLSCITTDKIADEIRKRKNLQKKLKKSEFCIENIL